MRGHEHADRALAAAPSRELRQGLLSNLANPKMAVFFSSLLPQFGGSLHELLAHGLIFCALTMAWLSGYAYAVARAGDELRRRRVRRTIDALTGTALVAFGVVSRPPTGRRRRAAAQARCHGGGSTSACG